MFSASLPLSSCAFDPNPGEHLQQEVERLQTLTIPPDSQLVDRHPPAIQRFGARADWEFQTHDSADAYNSWVAEKLRPDFRPYGSPKSPARFSKYDRGDTENLLVATAPFDGTLRVTITLEIYPD